MARWHASRLIGHVGYEQFLHLTACFRRLMEDRLRQRIRTAVDLYSRPMTYMTFLDRELDQVLQASNDAARFMSVTSPFDVLESQWRKAAHVNVDFRPTEPSEVHRHAFGNIEFKGRFPGRVTFYAQPESLMDFAGAADVRRDMMPNPSRFWLLSPGGESHGERSMMIPSCLPSVLSNA